VARKCNIEKPFHPFDSLTLAQDGSTRAVPKNGMNSELLRDSAVVSEAESRVGPATLTGLSQPS